MNNGHRNVLLPDSATLVARLAQLGIADDDHLISIVTMPKVYAHTLRWKDAGNDELPANAVVSVHVGQRCPRAVAGAGRHGGIPA